MIASFPLCWQLVRLGFRSLMLHKMRSALTVLGMVFGVASVVSILAVGEGASHTVQEELRRLGPDRIMIRSQPPVDAPRDSKQRLEYGLTNADLRRIETLVPGLRSVAPSFELTKNVYVKDRKAEPPL